MGGDRLRVFVSSKMAELAAERAVIKDVLAELKVEAWVFEEDAGARPETIEETFKEQLRAADLYIGVFWKGFGAYTIEEFDLARATGTDCLIYQKEGDRAEGRDPRLRAFLDGIGRVESGLTSQFFDSPEELGEMVKRDTARWQTRIVRKYRQGDRRRGAGAPTDPKLAALRSKVKQSWVDGVLGRATGETGLVELVKKSRPEAVEPPTALGAPATGEKDQAIERGMSVAEIFDRSEGSLLILGPSGSGKTTTALELTRDLIARAERNESQPVPVVLNLSSWSRGSRTLIGWIASELSDKYQVPERISRPWLELDRLVLILDGLDEVAAKRRRACVEAINRFGHEYGADGLVVTSRLEEYEDLAVRLRFNRAICLEPLGPADADAYLERAGGQLVGLRAALGRDEALQKLARSPLMLSVMSVAYRDRSVEEIEAGESATGESRGEHLLRVYAERAFLEHESGRPYSREATTSWLSWLAGRMTDRSRSLFLIEHLQPDWLVTRAQLRAYLLGLAVVIGVILGGLCVAYRLTPSAISSGETGTVGAEGYAPPSAAEAVGWLVACSLFGLGIGITDGFRRDSAGTEASGAGAAVLRIAVSLAIYVLLWAPVLVAQLLLWARGESLGLDQVLNQVTGSTHSDEVATALETFVLRFAVPGLGLTMAAAALAGRRSVTRSIRMAESLSFERAAAPRGAVWGLVAGGVFALLTYAVEKHWASSFWLVLGAPFGAVLTGFQPQLVRGKAIPNQGVRLTIRSSLRAGLMAVPLAALGPAFCLLLVVGGATQYADPARVTQWSITALLFLFVGIVIWFGGLDVVKHYVLRAVIGATRQGPWDFRRMLNYASRLNLMQRVGGGYMFLNRQLQDHFAGMDLPPPEADQVRAREREDAGSIPAMVAVGAVALAGAATLYVGLVAKLAVAVTVGGALIALGALWLTIRTAIISALRAARSDEEER